MCCCKLPVNHTRNSIWLHTLKLGQHVVWASHILMVSRDLLCTVTLESASLPFEKDIAGMLMLALQVYLPPREVCSGLKARVRVVFVPTVTGGPTVMSSPPTTCLSVSRHSRVGSTTKFSITMAVQVIVYACPAVETPLE